MCYYNGQKVSRSEFIRLLSLERAVSKYDFLNHAVQNGFAYSPIAVLKPDETEANFDIVQMEWGFLPPLKDREAVEKFRNGYKNSQGKWINGKPCLNAKAENLFISENTGGVSMFADAARNRRCLVLSTGFYEWQHIYPKNKRTGEPVKTPVKYPYFISLKESEYFYMAAIWQEWVDKTTGEIVNTVAVTTAPANKLMVQVHNSRKRMPTILNDELAYRWIFDDLNDDQIMEIASTQYPANKMDACTIAKEFLSTLDPATPFTYEELPALELAL